MITVHHLEKSRSLRILWLLEELELDYELVEYARQENMLAPPAMREIHPLGKSPIITDGDRVLAESGAIIEYLVEMYGDGRLRPETGTPQWVRWVYWMHYAEGSVMPPLVLKIIFEQIEQAPLPFFLRPVVRMISQRVQQEYINRQIRLHMTYCERELEDRPWFVGDEFTTADIQMSYPLEAASVRAGFGSDYPNLESYVERFRARPAYQRALEKAGPAVMGL